MPVKMSVVYTWKYQLTQSNLKYSQYLFSLVLYQYHSIITIYGISVKLSLWLRISHLNFVEGVGIVTPAG